MRGTLFGFGRTTGIYLAAGATGWTLTGNEIRDSGMDNPDGDGITINAGTTNTSTGNLITGASTQGIVVTTSASGNVFTNNTVTGNGVGIPTGLVQSSGIVVRTTAASTTLDRNVIHANYGAGVLVNPGSTGTRMTRNSFALNGTITARNLAGPTGQIGIDLNSPTDDINFGTLPFHSPNDVGDADSGGNGLLNFPVLLSANLLGGNLILSGLARPGSVIELFVASPDPTGFGEGTTYGITLTEGGTGSGGNDPYADTSAVTGTYGPGPVNGIAQGTDTTSRFRFAFPAPVGIAVGTRLTATATLGGETSEFSGNVTVADATAVTLMSFEAAPSDGTVDLTWRTGSEVDNLGFHVYRSLSEEGPWTRLTSSLIPGQGFSAMGAAYAWHDSSLTNGVRYFYRLEDVDSKAISTYHGPVSAVPGATAPPSEGGGTGGSGGSSSGSGALPLLPCMGSGPARLVGFLHLRDARRPRGNCLPRPLPHLSLRSRRARDGGLPHRPRRHGPRPHSASRFRLALRPVGAGSALEARPSRRRRRPPGPHRLHPGPREPFLHRPRRRRRRLPAGRRRPRRHGAAGPP